MSDKELIKQLEQELNRAKLILVYAQEEIKEKHKEIERLNKIINYLLDNSDEANNVYEEYKKENKE